MKIPKKVIFIAKINSKNLMNDLFAFIKFNFSLAVKDWLYDMSVR